MANAVYDKGREAFATAGISFTADTIKFVLVDQAQYTPNLATHQFLSDIPVGARVATSPALTGKTATAGVLNSSATTIVSVTGVSYEYVAMFKDTGSAATSPLIALYDTASIGLPGTPNGNDISITPNSSGWLKI